MERAYSEEVDKLVTLPRHATAWDLLGWGNGGHQQQSEWTETTAA